MRRHVSKLGTSITRPFHAQARYYRKHPQHPERVLRPPGSFRFAGLGSEAFSLLFLTTVARAIHEYPSPLLIFCCCSPLGWRRERHSRIRTTPCRSRSPRHRRRARGCRRFAYFVEIDQSNRKRTEE